MVRVTFCYYVAECHIRYGLPLLRLLAPPCKGPSDRGFFHRAESSRCILQPIAMFCSAALAARPPSNDLPTSRNANITRPSISIPSVSLIFSHFPPFSPLKYSSRHLSAFPEKKHQIPIMSSRKGTKEEQTFPNERLTNVFSRFWVFSCVIIGNFYSINNYSETRSARIFFAQGCEVNVEVENTPT